MFIDESLISKRPLSDVTFAVIHHTVMSEYADITEVYDVEKPEGFLAVGYHEYCKKLTSGEWVMQSGRAINDIPAAAYGLNEQSYDIAFGGNYQVDVKGVPTIGRLEDDAVECVVGQILLAKKRLPNLKYLIGHYQVAHIKAHEGLNPGDYSTACPGTNVISRLDYLRARTGLVNHPHG